MFDTPILKFSVQFEADAASLQGIEATAAGIGSGISESLSGATGALADLGSEALDSGRSLGDFERSSTKSGRSLADFGREASGSSRSLSALSGVLSLLSPGLGSAVQATATLTRGLQVLRLSLGPVAVAAGVATAAFALYSHEQERLADAAKVAAEQTEALTQALAEQAQVGSPAADQLRLIRGEIDDLGLASEREAEQVRAAAQASIAAIDAQIETQKERISWIKETTRVSLEQQAQIHKEEEHLARLQSQRADIQETERGQLGTLEAVLEYRREEVAETERLREREEAVQRSRGASAERAREQAAAERELAQARARQQEEYLALQAEVAGITSAAQQSQLTQVESLIAAYDAQILRLDQIEQATLGAAQTGDARAALELQFIADLEAARSESIERIRQQEQAEHEERLGRLREQQRLTAETLSSTGDLFGSLSQIAAASAREQAESNEAAAQRQLEVSKRLAVAEATASLAQGLMGAAAAFVANPVSAGVAATALLATYAQQLQAIESLSLHAGGLRRVMPDEAVRGGTVVLQEERVLSPRASRELGAEGARRLERGQQGGAGVVFIETYKHFGRFSADETRRDSPLSRAIAQGRTTGRRGY